MINQLSDNWGDFLFLDLIKFSRVNPFVSIRSIINFYSYLGVKKNAFKMKIDRTIAGNQEILYCNVQFNQFKL